MLKKILNLFMICLCLVSASSFAKSYTLGAGDTVRISVYGEQDLTFDRFLIDSSQTIDYPYLGIIDVKNMTIRDLQKYITVGLKDGYLVDPKVTVNMVKYRNVFVSGVVNKPGAYEYQPDLTVEKAIALAGGFLAKYRKTRGIYLTKESEVNGLSQQEINALLKDKKEADLQDKVSPGDTIYVVSSFW